MKEFLDGFLPRILPEGVTFTVVPHEGKSDLERSLPRKLRGWRTPDTRFVVVRDQDSARCVDVKASLVRLCAQAGRPDSLVRVACHELESWFLGDLQALADAYGTPALSAHVGRSKWRDPDRLGSPSQELVRLVPTYQKVAGARLMGPRLDPSRCTSGSLRTFVSGVQRLVSEAA